MVGILGQDFSVGCCVEACWEAGNSENTEGREESVQGEQVTGPKEERGKAE